jgi:hypothetical protein
LISLSFCKDFCASANDLAEVFLTLKLKSVKDYLSLYFLLLSSKIEINYLAISAPSASIASSF